MTIAFSNTVAFSGSEVVCKTVASENVNHQLEIIFSQLTKPGVLFFILFWYSSHIYTSSVNSALSTNKRKNFWQHQFFRRYPKVVHYHSIGICVWWGMLNMLKAICKVWNDLSNKGHITQPYEHIKKSIYCSYATSQLAERKSSSMKLHLLTKSNYRGTVCLCLCASVNESTPMQ